MYKSFEIVKNRRSLKHLVGGILLWGLVFFLSYIDKSHWLFDLMSYSIPILMIVELAIMLRLLFVKDFLSFAVLAIMGLCCFKPVKETVGFGQVCVRKPSKEDGIPSQLRVFSFNASTFNTRRKVYDRQDSTFVDNLCSYFKNSEEQPDIMCFQEFHHDDWERKRVIEELVQVCHTKYYYMLPFWRNYQNGIFGLIILSKYPIVNKGVLFSDGPYSFNKGIFVDVQYGQDTIRVINLHLQSMSIRVKDSLVVDGFGKKISNTIQKLKNSSQKRKLQVDTIEHIIQQSHHPVILCGDLNSFPYGYSYQKIKKYLKNAFEESGRGFGFTLNIAPYFIRLDNQFCSKQFVPTDAKVIREIDKSDHFPLLCNYQY